MAVHAYPSPRAVDTSVRGLHVRYYTWGGEGHPVVMLHNSRGYARIWDFVTPYLLPDFRVIAPDQRGHGDTGKPATGYAGEDFAQDLEALADQLHLDQVHLVGHSLGGRVAQIFAGLHPGRVAKLVLVGGPHYESFSATATAESVRLVWKRAQTCEETPRSFPIEQAALEYLKLAYPTLSEPMRRHMLECNMNHHPDGKLSFKFDPSRVADDLRHIPDDLTKYAEKTTCPVLFILRNQGTEHHYLSPEQANAIARLFRSTRVDMVGVDGVRIAELENPEGVGRAIRKFLLS